MFYYNATVKLVDIDAGFAASEVDLVIDLLTQKRSRLVSLTINSDRLKLSYLPPYSPPTSGWSCRSTDIGSKKHCVQGLRYASAASL